MDNYLAIKCDFKEDFDKIQMKFLNDGFIWIDNKKGYRDIFDINSTFLIDYKRKKLGIHDLENKYPYYGDENHFSIDKLITYKQFLRTDKLKRIIE